MLLLAALLCSCPIDGAAVMAEWQPVQRVKDADTFELVNRGSFGLPVSIRLRGVDTPESGSRGKCKAERSAAKRADAFARELIAGSGWLVRLSNVRHDKFGGRFDADVRVLSDGAERSLSAALIDAGHARAYAGGKRGSWCRRQLSARITSPITSVTAPITPAHPAPIAPMISTRS